MQQRAFLVLILTVCMTIAAQARAQTSTTSPISIEHAWARATLAGAKTGAVYLTVINHGAAADRLVGASTPMAEKVQFHQETDDKGVMRMRELPTVEVGSGTTFAFKPGGTHVMIVGIKQALKAGQTFPLTLEFEKAGKIELQIPIAKAGAMGTHGTSGVMEGGMTSVVHVT